MRRGGQTGSQQGEGRDDRRRTRHPLPGNISQGEHQHRTSFLRTSRIHLEQNMWQGTNRELGQSAYRRPQRSSGQQVLLNPPLIETTIIPLLPPLPFFPVPIFYHTIFAPLLCVPHQPSLDCSSAVTGPVKKKTPSTKTYTPPRETTEMLAAANLFEKDKHNLRCL